jgi:hypothetical protein
MVTIRANPLNNSPLSLVASLDASSTGCVKPTPAADTPVSSTATDPAAVALGLTPTSNVPTLASSIPVGSLNGSILTMMTQMMAMMQNMMAMMMQMLGGPATTVPTPVPVTGTTGTVGGTGTTGTTNDGLTAAERAALAAANPGAAVDPSADINRSKNFHNEDNAQRTADGLDDHDRAIIHLWGRQIISAGKEDGGILLNVQGDVGHTFNAEEHKVADELIAQDQQDYGGITGKSLDKEFFKIMQKLHPDTTIDTSKWLNTPVNFAKGPVNFISDVNGIQQQTGLTQFDQGVLRLWGHDPLTNGGKIDGSILAYTIGNPNALDNIANGGNGDKSENIDIDNIAQGLLTADVTQDGIRNGDSLSFAFGRVLDKVYLGKSDDNMAFVQQNAATKAAQAGRTPQQITADVASGFKQAATDTAQIIKDHPFLSATAIAGSIAAGAVCPFLGGLALGGVGITTGQQLLNSGTSNNNTPQ